MILKMAQTEKKYQKFIEYIRLRIKWCAIRLIDNQT